MQDRKSLRTHESRFHNAPILIQHLIYCLAEDFETL